MKEKMIQYVEKHRLFSHGDKLVVGVSGGADSVCLLHLLKACEREWELSLFVVHIHHGIRGAEADSDAAFVAGLAEQLSLPFFLVRGDIPALAEKSGMSEEEAGRQFRYDELEKIRREQRADYIAVAHHRDDQAETVLFRLFRGTGVRGLAGMEPKRGVVIRPLLFASGKDLRKMLYRHGYEWQEDATNRDRTYCRNWIRHELLPLVTEHINAQAVSHIAKTAADVAQWRDLIEKLTQRAASQVLAADGRQKLLYVEAFQKQEKVIQNQLLRLFVSGGLSGAMDISRVHYEQIRKLCDQETGRCIDLPQGYVVERSYDCLRLLSKSDFEGRKVRLECEIPSEIIVEMEDGTYKLTFRIEKREELVGEIPEKDYTKWFDYDKINNGLILRNPEEGDFFILDAQGHTKKLARHYMDLKIPKSLRGRQLVLADGSHIIWAFPERISENYKITRNTKRVLVVTRERIRHERTNQGINCGRGPCCQNQRTGGTD